MTFTVMVLLLLLATTLINQAVCQPSVAGTLFNSSEELENVTLQYYQALNPRFEELWLFPSIRFRTNGTIFGWRFSSTEIKGGGGGRPRLSVWSPDSQDSDTYNLRESRVMVNCITSEADLPSGETIQFHVGGPTSGIVFNEGDIIGILYRASSIASFAPYLYNTSAINPFGEQTTPLLGYSLPTRGERDRLSLRNLQAATFLPVLALNLCVENTTVTDGLPIEICVGNDNLDWESECEEPDPPSTTTSEESNTTTVIAVTRLSPTAHVTIMTTTKSPSTDREELADSGTLELIIIVVPAVGGAILLAICLLVVMIVCCSCLCRLKKRKRRKSLQIVYADIPMESIDHSSTVMGNGVHTYDTLKQIDGQITTSPITTELNDHGNKDTAANGTVDSANGDLQSNLPSVAIYERPIFSQSQYEDPGYDQPIVHSKPVNKHLKVGGGSLSPRIRTPLPELPHPYGVHQLSPLMPRTPVLTHVIPPPATSFYHTLETGSGTPPLNNTLRLSSVITHTTRARKDNGNPRQSPSPKSSPEPRYRLRSSSQGMRTPNTSYTGSLEPATPTTFFSLETGVYVPTQDQRNQFESFKMDSEPIFDDTVYACLSQAPHSPFVNNWSFFEESESYWKPASNSNALYEQLSHRKYREILRKQIEITGHLGSGQFGKVAKGVWHTEQGDLDIAMKKLNDKASERDTVRFLQEAAIMGQFKHPNIVRLHGVVTVGNPVMIVLELMRNGDLRNYLKSVRPVPGEMVPGDLPQKLLEFCSQIALGMEYLSRKDFVHRDLATRNILLTEDYVCKIADFGMSRDLDDEDYYMSQGGMIPIKWTAPEALNFRKYSTASDVWSFGVLVYEVWSLGHMPFRNKTPDETITLVESGYRLPPPPGCPRAVYQLMIDCWHPDHSKRPTFTKLVQSLSQPEEVLLKWTSEDSNIHHQITSLGAPLEVGEKLYSDLSKIYTKYST